jgi:chemotaxis protein MotB
MDMGQIRAERRADISRMAIQIASLPGMEAQEGAGGVRITVPEKTLFAPGAADLENNGLEILMRLVSVLRKSGVFISVEGHADNLPIANDRFVSNWELSAARAVSVVTFLAGEGGINPERLFAVGYGDTRPLAANDTVENRQKNRRVEINLKFQD